MEYKEQYGKDGCSLSWKSGSQTLEVVPSDKLYVGNSKIHAEIASMGDGTYRGRYITTVSGTYQTFLSMNTAGGLQATYYNDAECTKYAYHRTDAELNFDWGIFSPHRSIPSDFFCARWSGMLAPLSSEEHRFIVSADDSAKLWILSLIHI